MKKTFLKKTLLVLLGVTASHTALADAITGAYIQGDIGLTYMKADGTHYDSVRNAIKTSYNESKIMPRVSVGYDFGDWRVAGDYTHYANIEDSTTTNKFTTKVRGAGVSAIYDFNTALPVPVQPYVGARVSVNKVKQESIAFGNNALISNSNSSTKVSPGVLAGMNYKLDNHFTVDAGYRYNHLDSSVQTHEASVGLRYTF